MFVYQENIALTPKKQQSRFIDIVYIYNVITHSCSNFNGGLIKLPGVGVRAWTGDCIPYATIDILHIHALMSGNICFVKWTIPWFLTHWGRVTHICVGNLTIIGSDNGLSPGRRQAIICTNIINWTLGNKFQWNFSRNYNIFIQEKVFESVVCKMAAILTRPQCVNTIKKSRCYHHHCFRLTTLANTETTEILKHTWNSYP